MKRFFMWFFLIMGYFFVFWLVPLGMAKEYSYLINVLGLHIVIGVLMGFGWAIAAAADRWENRK